MVGGRCASGAGTSSGPAASSAANGFGPVVGQPVRAVPPRPRARQPGQAGGRAAAEGEHVEAVAGAEDRVRLGARAVQDAVAGAHRVRAPVLPAEALAAEDVEELLLVGVDVDRHRALARRRSGSG